MLQYCTIFGGSCDRYLDLVDKECSFGRIDCPSHIHYHCALALGIGGLCGVDDEIKHPEEHSKYEVLIEDDASFKEITEYYEIDSTKGKIYVLKPKK